DAVHTDPASQAAATRALPLAELPVTGPRDAHLGVRFDPSFRGTGQQASSGKLVEPAVGWAPVPVEAHQLFAPAFRATEHGAASLADARLADDAQAVVAQAETRCQPQAVAPQGEVAVGEAFEAQPGPAGHLGEGRG